MSVRSSIRPAGPAASPPAPQEESPGSTESPVAVVDREAAYLVPTYERTPFHPRSGRGARLVDASGRLYWDLLAGIAVNALGHRHPALTRTLRREAGNLWHVSNLYYHPAQGMLAQKLVETSRLNRAFFCNSGTEANEAALKFARLKNPGRGRVVALEEAFHGRTFGALSVTGHEPYRTPFSPLVPGGVFVPPNNVESLAAAVTPDTSAVILEPVQGEAGVIPLSAAYLQAARAITQSQGALLIVDEIQCGLGRTGSLFAFQDAFIAPDVVTLAKPLGGGLPLGAVLVGPALEGVIRPGDHGTTFGGNPLAVSLGLAFLEEIERTHLVERVRLVGRWFGQQLQRLAARRSEIKAVRGRGLMWGLELDRTAAPVARRLLELGFVVGTARGSVIRLLPPYIVPRRALAAFLIALEKALEESNS